MRVAAEGSSARGRRAAAASLYAAGFTTAFGAHSIAANLGGYTGARHEPLIVLGVLLAAYDGAEVALKPVFGALMPLTESPQGRSLEFPTWLTFSLLRLAIDYHASCRHVAAVP